MKRDKGLMNEILPDPEQAARDLRNGSPRDRTTAHLKRIVAAAAAAALPFSAALADNSVPGEKRDGGKSGESQKEGQPKKPPEEQPGYGVVDPMPQPYINRTLGEGAVRITSKPAGASVLVDGKDIGRKTPVAKLKLPAGMHAISATSADGKITKNLTVEIKAGGSVSESFDLRPPPPPKKTPTK